MVLTLAPHFWSRGGGVSLPGDSCPLLLPAIPCKPQQEVQKLVWTLECSIPSPCLPWGVCVLGVGGCCSVVFDSLQPHGGLSSVMNSPGKNTGVGGHSLLQEIFPTQGLNLDLTHCRQILYHWSHQGHPLSSLVVHHMSS